MLPSVASCAPMVKRRCYTWSPEILPRCGGGDVMMRRQAMLPSVSSEEDLAGRIFVTMLKYNNFFAIIVMWFCYLSTKIFATMSPARSSLMSPAMSILLQ